MNKKSKDWIWILGLGFICCAAWYLCSKFYRSVYKAIHSWNPEGGLKNEIALRKSLAKHLRQSLPESYMVIEEYAKERSKVDIALAENTFQKEESEIFAIELKFRLKKKTDIDRLIGQIMGYKALGFNKSFVVNISPETNLSEVLAQRSQCTGLIKYLTVIKKDFSLINSGNG